MIQLGLGIRALMWSDAEVPGRVIPAEIMMMIMHVSHGHVHVLGTGECEEHKAGAYSWPIVMSCMRHLHSG